jgi:argininosuccinate lyase
MAKKAAASKALWGGRFKKGLHPTLKEYSYSLPVDIQMLEAEIAIDIAWARMLAKGKLIKESEAQKMVSALIQIEKELDKKLESDNMAWMDDYEDIHSLIQSELEKKIGVLGKKIHTGRSRNDLVVTSSKLILSHHCTWIESQITYLQAALVLTARNYQDCLMAGVTHLRKAQPLLLAHHLLAYVEMLEEDRDRLIDAIKRLDVLPLGSAALAGSGLKIDQKFLAKELGFSNITRNSLHSVSDRAFITEIISVLSILWMHLSRLSEDFILWNSEFFGYVELDDAFSTGSSLMPQKKNPDVFELTRGKAGTIFGVLQAQLTMQKGLPLSYNRDLQEDKPQTFQAIAETGLALDVLAKTIITAKFNQEALAKSIEDDALYATDLLDYLVRKAMPFTEAHETVGKIVYAAQAKKVAIRKLTIEEFEGFSKLFKKDVYQIFDGWKSISAKTTQGSTHPDQVEKEISRWEQILEISYTKK